MPILNKKKTFPEDEVVIPYKAKKINGYYTSIADSFQDGMKAMQDIKNANTNDYSKLLNHIIKEEGGTPEQYKKLQDQIAFHESAGTMDPAIKQKGGGPGRGKYQFEEGNEAGGKIAVKHTVNYLKQIGEKVPKWLNELNNQSSVDASKLTSEQQDMIFLGHYKMHPKADFKKIMTGEESIVDFWGKYHQTSNDPVKKERFLSDVERYNAKINKDKASSLASLKKGGILYHK